MSFFGGGGSHVPSFLPSHHSLFLFYHTHQHNDNKQGQAYIISPTCSNETSILRASGLLVVHPYVATQPSHIPHPHVRVRRKTLCGLFALQLRGFSCFERSAKGQIEEEDKKNRRNRPTPSTRSEPPNTRIGYVDLNARPGGRHGIDSYCRIRKAIHVNCCCSSMRNMNDTQIDMVAALLQHRTTSSTAAVAHRVPSSILKVRRRQQSSAC